jgi:hypothetical protein
MPIPQSIARFNRYVTNPSPGRITGSVPHESLANQEWRYYRQEDPDCLRSARMKHTPETPISVILSEVKNPTRSGPHNRGGWSGQEPSRSGGTRGNRMFTALRIRSGCRMTPLLAPARHEIPRHASAAARPQRPKRVEGVVESPRGWCHPERSRGTPTSARCHRLPGEITWSVAMWAPCGGMSFI